MTAGHALRRADDLPDVLDAHLRVVAAGVAVAELAEPCPGGWLVSDRHMGLLRDAVGRLQDRETA